MSDLHENSRRTFLKNTMKATAGTVALAGFPTIVPASVFGKNAPSNKINIGQIGIGRIAPLRPLQNVPALAFGGHAATGTVHERHDPVDFGIGVEHAGPVDGVGDQLGDRGRAIHRR